jgi:hypothetical protein
MPGKTSKTYYRPQLKPVFQYTGVYAVHLAYEKGKNLTKNRFIIFNDGSF